MSCYFTDYFMIPTSFIFGFCITFIGYMAQSSFLQYFYYCLQASKPYSWKIQPNVNLHHLNYYFLPFISSKPDRAPYHGVISLLNLCTASAFCGMIFEMCNRKNSLLEFMPTYKYGFFNILAEFLVSVAYECVVEYYWHRLMHLKYFYSIFHKYHHYYKSPEVWDDMYIHPVEAFGYYCILYSPPFIHKIHAHSFVLYMITMGICGVLDHSGINIALLGCYNAEDHDVHHSKFNVNYGFPLPVLDIIHGTYHGRFLGVTFNCLKIATSNQS